MIKFQCEGFNGISGQAELEIFTGECDKRLSVSKRVTNGFLHLIAGISL